MQYQFRHIQNIRPLGADSVTFESSILKTQGPFLLRRINENYFIKPTLLLEFAILESDNTLLSSVLIVLARYSQIFGAISVQSGTAQQRRVALVGLVVADSKDLLCTLDNFIDAAFAVHQIACQFIMAMHFRGQVQTIKKRHQIVSACRESYPFIASVAWQIYSE